MMVNCPICGKLTCIHWPEHWVYRRGASYYCSSICMDISVVRDTRLMNQVLRRRKGIVARLKKDGTPAKKPGPRRRIETPEAGRMDAAETPEGTLAEAMTGMKDAADEFFGACEDMGLDMNGGDHSGLFQDTIGVKAAEGAVTRPVNYDGLDVTAVRHPDLGEFYYDQKYSCIDWRTPEGDEVSLGPAWWRQMADELPKILKVLGVWE